MPELFDEGKYRILRVGNFFNSDKWYYSDLELDDDKYCYDGDLLFAWSCSFGPKIWHGEKTIYHYHIWKLVENSDLIDRRWLYYWLNCAVAELTAGNHGSVMMHMTKGEMENMPINLPPLPTQRRIAAVLGALDDKIELNRKMNANLEAQAQALFKSWFVDFAPWGGKMPKEWKMGTLGELAVYYDGTISAGELSSRNYFSTENMVANKGGVVDASSVPIEGSVPECVESCILVSNIRPYFKKIHRVLSRGGHSNDVLCFKAKDRQYEWFLYQLLFEDAFFDHMMSGAKGTKMPRGDKRQILSYPCYLPSKDAAEAFGKKVSPLCRMIALNIEESRKLAETRDALLAKLMSGEVEVV